MNEINKLNEISQKLDLILDKLGFAPAGPGGVRLRGEKLQEKIIALTDEGYSKRQIAEMLNVSMATVANARRRAREIENQFLKSIDIDQQEVDSMIIDF